MSGGKTRSSKLKDDPDTKAAMLHKVVPKTKKVFFIKESLFRNAKTRDDWQLEYFHHPGTDSKALFLTCDDQIMEVLQFDEPRRSWLIGREICCNGRIYITVPMDSTFLALYYLRKNCRERAMALDCMHDGNDLSAVRLLSKFVRESAVRSVADVKTSGDMCFYMYNREKTIAWLALKTKRVASALRITGVHCGHSAKSQNYTRSEKAELDETVSDEDFTRMACDIVGNYIDMELHEELKTYLEIPSEIQAIVEEKKSNASKRKTIELLNGNNNKKAKINTNKDSLNEEFDIDKAVSADVMAATPIKERSLSTKEKALAKSAKGTKSIASFFKK